MVVVGEGYGGLEHRASTALLCSRADLPWKGMDTSTEGLPAGYKTFLGLCSHEYFHSWNVKRIRPAAFVPYDLARERYTRQLWAFEGITSYYDDLALLRLPGQTPMARFGEPQELVGAAILLVSRTAGSFITGADYYVDGGFTAMRF